MNHRRTIIHALLLGAAICVQTATFAQDATTKPTRTNSRSIAGPTGEPRDRDRYNENRPNNPPPGPVSQEAPNDDEWKDISDFVVTYMPNRWKIYEDIRSVKKEDAKVVQNIKQRLAIRYRQLMRTKATNPALYDTQVEQAKKEDDVWGALQTYRNAPIDANKSTLQDKVRLMVNNLLDERQKRIDQIKDNLDNEEKQLSWDKENIDQIVAHRMDQVINNGRPFADIVPQGQGFGGGGKGRGPKGNDDHPSTQPAENPQ